MRKCQKALLFILLFLVVIGVFVGILLVVPKLEKEVNEGENGETQVKEDAETPEGEVDRILVTHNPNEIREVNNDNQGSRGLYPYNINEGDDIIQYETAYNTHASYSNNNHNSTGSGGCDDNLDDELSFIPSDAFSAVQAGDIADVPVDDNHNSTGSGGCDDNLDDELSFIPSDAFSAVESGDIVDVPVDDNHNSTGSGGCDDNLDDELSFIPSDAFSAVQAGDIVDVPVDDNHNSTGSGGCDDNLDDELSFIPSDAFSAVQAGDIADVPVDDKNTSSSMNTTVEEEEGVELLTVCGTDFQNGLDVVLSLFSALKTEQVDGNPHQLLVNYFGTDAIKLGALFKSIETTLKQIRENFYWLVDPNAKVPRLPSIPQGMLEDALVELPGNLELILKAANTWEINYKYELAADSNKVQSDSEIASVKLKGENRDEPSGVLHKCEDPTADLLGIVDILVKHWSGFKLKHSRVLKLSLEWLLIFYDKVNKARLNAWNNEFEQWLITQLPTNVHEEDAKTDASDASLNARGQNVLATLGAMNTLTTRPSSTSSKVLANTCLEVVFAGYEELLAYAISVVAEPPNMLEQQLPPCQYILTPFFDVVCEFFNILEQNAPTASVTDDGTNSINNKKNEALVQVIRAFHTIFKTHNRNNLHYQKLGDAEKFYTAETELLQLLRHLYPLLQQWKKGKMDEITNKVITCAPVNPKPANAKAKVGQNAFHRPSRWRFLRC